MTSQTTSKSSKDLYSQCEQEVDSYFDLVEKSVPTYHQKVANLQQQYLEAWDKVIDSNLELQREYANLSGSGSMMPDAVIRGVHQAYEEFSRAFSVQNQILLQTIEANRKNIETFNQSVQSFGDLNKKILQSWISVFTPTKD